MFFPEIINTREYLFSKIEDAILKDEVQAGVIIHENRFTYESKGLHKIADLGELWEMETRMPVPLGGIAIRRSLPAEMKKAVNILIRNSVLFAFTHPQSSREYVQQHSQELSEEITRKHISLYVNNHSIGLDEKGKQAIRFFLNQSHKTIDNIFVV
jgi:1,4-dihydroxy-6-naphthoate synthase